MVNLSLRVLGKFFNTRKNLSNFFKRSFLKLGVGDELFSQAVARQVFSLKWVFTTVFGMGTGGFLTLGHQRILVNTLCVESCIKIKSKRNSSNFKLGKALVRLVSVDWICCHTYISDLSTTWSSWGLTDLCHERSHLTVGFVLICFQHLSAWNTATGRLLLAE